MSQPFNGSYGNPRKNSCCRDSTLRAAVCHKIVSKVPYRVNPYKPTFGQNELRCRFELSDARTRSTEFIAVGDPVLCEAHYVEQEYINIRHLHVND